MPAAKIALLTFFPRFFVVSSIRPIVILEFEENQHLLLMNIWSLTFPLKTFFKNQ